MASGLLECSRPSAWPSSWTATRKRSLPVWTRRRHKSGGERYVKYALHSFPSITRKEELELIEGNADRIHVTLCIYTRVSY